jgi:hypothetical protein
MRGHDPLLPVQLLGMVAVVGMEALAQAQLPPETPRLTRVLAWAIVAALLAFWWWSVPRRRRLFAADEDRRADHLLFLVLWAGSFGTVGQIFLLFPWLPDADRLFIVMFCIATVAVLAFAAVERPPATGAPLLLPLVIPAGLVGWYLLNPVPLRWPVIAAVLIFTALFWLLRAQVQRLVNQTHAAMIGADTARTEAIAAREAKTRFDSSLVDMRAVDTNIQKEKRDKDIASAADTAAKQADDDAKKKKALADVATQRTDIKTSAQDKIKAITVDAPIAASSAAAAGGFMGGSMNNQARLSEQREFKRDAIEREKVDLLSKINNKLDD